MLRRRTPSRLPTDPVPHEVRVGDQRLATYTVPASAEAGADRPPLHFVVCHGFTNHAARPSFERIVAMIARFGAVTAFDFRGHGRSEGGSSVGGDGELADLDAVIADVRRRDPGATVVTIGFSMGGSVVIRQAARGVARPEVVAAISPVSRWYVRDTGPMRRVHWLLESRLGPRIAPYAVRTRLGEPWADVPEQPIDVVAEVPPTPLLIVHGTADRYFGLEHARALHAAADERSTLWIVPGFGHAESGMRPALLARILRWCRAEADTLAHDDAAPDPATTGGGG